MKTVFYFNDQHKQTARMKSTENVSAGRSSQIFYLSEYHEL